MYFWWDHFSNDGSIKYILLNPTTNTCESIIMSKKWIQGKGEWYYKPNKQESINIQGILSLIIYTWLIQNECNYCCPTFYIWICTLLKTIKMHLLDKIELDIMRNCHLLNLLLLIACLIKLVLDQKYSEKVLRYIATYLK